jgi:hypothetical protein
VDANGHNHRRNQDRNIHERSPAAALPRPLRKDAGKVRHFDREHDKRPDGQADCSQGEAMDGIQSRFVDAGLDRLPPALDDNEIICVGEPIWDVIKVAAVGPLTLAVEFEDGTKGKVCFKQSSLRGVFAKLKDAEYFARVGIAHGAVSWPNEQPDLAPDVMYDEIKAHGEWVLN